MKIPTALLIFMLIKCVTECKNWLGSQQLPNTRLLLATAAAAVETAAAAAVVVRPALNPCCVPHDDAITCITRHIFNATMLATSACRVINIMGVRVATPIETHADQCR